jgi:hypothetical protein
MSDWLLYAGGTAFGAGVLWVRLIDIINSLHSI